MNLFIFVGVIAKILNVRTERKLRLLRAKKYIGKQESIKLSSESDDLSLLSPSIKYVSLRKDRQAIHGQEYSTGRA